MTSSEVFRIDSTEEGERVLERIRGRFPTRLHPPASVRRTYLDTFDWRIRRAGRTLSREEERGVLLSELDGRSVARADVEGVPAFAAELPAGMLADWLAPVLEDRRLFRRVETRERARVLDVLDDEEKTVSRVVLESGEARRIDGGMDAQEGARGEPGELSPRLRVVPLRGYEAEHSTLAAFVREELGLPEAERFGFDLAVDASAAGPCVDPSKARVELDPAEPAEPAVKRVLRGLLDVLHANEPGVRADLDVEFLHDYRVAVRRTRSLLGQLRHVLAPGAARRFAAEFGWLGRRTGPTRDLDVFLLELGGTSGAPELAPLREFVAERRAEEHRALVATLDSERMAELLATWEDFLGSAEVTGAGERPVGAVAGERIHRLHEKLVRRGRKVGRRTPVEDLHDLRIRAKKLRYALDCFRSLFDAEETDLFVRLLKRLQDVLGAFNDLHVQMAMLEELAGAMGRAGRGSPEALFAMGRLCERKERDAEKRRRKIRKRFRAFDDRELRGPFARLFHGENE